MWQPIETAPRDGTRALFYQEGNPRAEVPAARQTEMRVDFFNKRASSKNFYREWPEARYTHWMPLPEPPINQEEQR